MAHECPRHGVPAFGFRGCYDCVKNLAFGGERLTDPERAFAGFYPAQAQRDRWRPAMSVSGYELDYTLSAEDSAMLSALMSHPSADQLEFLG